MKKTSKHQCEHCQERKGQNSNNNENNSASQEEHGDPIASTLTKAAKKLEEGTQTRAGKKLEEAKVVPPVHICQCGNKQGEKQQKQEDAQKPFLKKVSLNSN